MLKTTPAQFFRQVKQEVSKITWPTRKEIFQVALVVIVMVALASVFFLFVDQICAFVVKMILRLGR
ncbi:MAG: preprotein translocase subunit SecE [Alphaproteobacteria bacterium]|nr:preprotein translocase subunit SecE [Alphaproteobacteria bacterium]NCB50099.1 preprotein translocase subunit SecE [Alphaproteobacteria bacterium]